MSFHFRASFLWMLSFLFNFIAKNKKNAILKWNWKEKRPKQKIDFSPHPKSKLLLKVNIKITGSTTPLSILPLGAKLFFKNEILFHCLTAYMWISNVFLLKKIILLILVYWLLLVVKQPYISLCLSVRQSISEANNYFPPLYKYSCSLNLLIRIPIYDYFYASLLMEVEILICLVEG